MAMHRLDVEKKRYIRTRIIAGAINYKLLLVNKKFLIICEDGTYREVCFMIKDYQHLTGVKSNLGNIDFFNNCYKRTISDGNIDNLQTHDWHTLKRKADRIEIIHRIFDSDPNLSLIIDNFPTRTKTFPIAVRNAYDKMCIGFISEQDRARKSEQNVARSLRVSQSIEGMTVKKIIAIFSKEMTGPSNYNKLVYVSNVSNVMAITSELQTLIDEDIYKKFLKVIEKETK